MIKELRHKLHRNAELSLNERRTVGIIKDFLVNNTALEVLHSDGWVLAVYRAKAQVKRPPIAFRADFDALPMDEGIDIPHASLTPGVAHKCGHDGHTAALCGFGAALEQLAPDRDVYLIFQHAEEIGAGGAECAKAIEGYGISEIYACHNWSGYPEGAILIARGTAQCASRGIRISFTGSHAHAGQPETGKNPSMALARLVMWLNDNNSRPGMPLVLSTVVGLKAGTGDFGMSADSGELCATLRAEREPDLDDLTARLKAEARALAEAEKMAVSFEDCDIFPETANDIRCAEKLERAAEYCGFNAIALQKPFRPSEDFGHYLKKCPGAIFYVGNGTDYPELHTFDYDFRDENIDVIIRMYKALTAL